jgi:hypothetical protein
MIGFGQSFHARCKVYGVSDNCVVHFALAADVADCNFAVIKSNAYLKFALANQTLVFVEFFDGLDHFKAGKYGL